MRLEISTISNVFVFTFFDCNSFICSYYSSPSTVLVSYNLLFSLDSGDKRRTAVVRESSLQRG